MIDKGDSTFKVVYSLLKIKSKAYISLKFLEIHNKHIFAWV